MFREVVVLSIPDRVTTHFLEVFKPLWDIWLDTATPERRQMVETCCPQEGPYTIKDWRPELNTVCKNSNKIFRNSVSERQLVSWQSASGFHISEWQGLCKYIFVPFYLSPAADLELCLWYRNFYRSHWDCLFFPLELNINASFSMQINCEASSLTSLLSSIPRIRGESKHP